MTGKKQDNTFDADEAKKRFETALRAGLNMPAKPHAKMKLGKSRAARKAKRKRPKKG
jgi:hypothetical protein